MASYRSRAVVRTSHPTIARWRTRALEVEGEGRVYLLLHGFADHAGTWLGVLDALADAGVHAVAVDMPGYGEADPIDAGPALPQLDEFARAAIERWTVDGVAPVLVGNSLGGVVAIRAGQDPTSGVAAVVPISPAGFGFPWYLGLLEKYSWMNPLMFTPVVPMKTFRLLFGAGFAWAVGGGGAKVRPGVGAGVAAQFRTRSDVKRILGTAPELFKELRAAEPTPVAVPCLIIWGRHDRVTSVSGAEPCSALAPGAEVTIYEDCGHSAQVARPDLVASSVLGFAASLVPLSGTGGDR